MSSGRNVIRGIGRVGGRQGAYEVRRVAVPFFGLVLERSRNAHDRDGAGSKGTGGGRGG